MAKKAQKPTLELITPTEKQKKAQRNRSIALGLALVAFVIIVYVATWVKLGPGALVRPM